MILGDLNVGLFCRKHTQTNMESSNVQIYSPIHNVVFSGAMGGGPGKVRSFKPRALCEIFSLMHRPSIIGNWAPKEHITGCLQDPSITGARSFSSASLSSWFSGGNLRPSITPCLFYEILDIVETTCLLQIS